MQGTCVPRLARSPGGAGAELHVGAQHTDGKSERLAVAPRSPVSRYVAHSFLPSIHLFFTLFLFHFLAYSGMSEDGKGCSEPHLLLPKGPGGTFPKQWRFFPKVELCIWVFK